MPTYSRKATLQAGESYVREAIRAMPLWSDPPHIQVERLNRVIAALQSAVTCYGSAAVFDKEGVQR